MWQAGRATSAAETYFPAFVLDDMVLWDGGNAVNNPAVSVYAEAVNLWGDDQDYKMLSIGCGKVKSKFDPQHMINPRVIHAAVEAFGLVFDANVTVPNYQMKAFLGHSYYRIQPDIPHTMALDDASADGIKKLQAATEQSLKDFSATLDEFVTKPELAQ